MLKIINSEIISQWVKFDLENDETLKLVLEIKSHFRGSYVDPVSKNESSDFSSCKIALQRKLLHITLHIELKNHSKNNQIQSQNKIIIR